LFSAKKLSQKKVIHLDAVITGGPGTSSGENLMAKNKELANREKEIKD